MRSQCSTKMWTSKQEGTEISDLTGRKVSCRYQEGKGKAKLHVHDTRMPTPSVPDQAADWITHVHDTCMPTSSAPEYGADWITHVHDTRMPTPSTPEYGKLDNTHV